MTLGFPQQRPVAPWSEHHWWGIWETPAQLPNVAGSLAQYEADVQEGDLAWVQSTILLYVCQDPTPNAAIWVPVGGGGPGGNDHFVPRIIVGNTLNGDPAPAQAPPFQYLPDPGNGSGIVAALAGAVAGYDVHIRPGTYTLPVGTVLTVPPGVTVSGEPGGVGSPSGTIIVASAGDANNAQDVFVLGTGSGLKDIQIRVPPGAGGGLAGNAIVNLPAAVCRVSRVLINMIFGGAGSQRNTTTAFGTVAGSAPSADTVIEDCETILPQIEATGLAYVHYLFGTLGTDSTTGNTDGPTVRNCRGLGGQAGVLMVTLAGGIVEDCTFLNMICSQFGSAGLFWILQETPLTFVNGPRFSDNLVIFNTVGDLANARATGYIVENDASIVSQTPNAIAQDMLIEGCRVIFDPAIVNTRCRGFDIMVSEVGQLRRGTVCDCISIGHDDGLKLTTGTHVNDATDVGAVNDITIKNVNVAEPLARISNGVGITLQIDNVPAQPKMNRVSVVDCNASQAPVAGFGIIVNDPGITRTLVAANQATPAGGTAILNAGTLTQLIGNQVV